jgi:putative oxidoreductase
VISQETTGGGRHCRRVGESVHEAQGHQLKCEGKKMSHEFLERYRNVLLLLARVSLTLLFIIFGWKKLIGFSGTSAYLGSIGLPAPVLAAAVAVTVELGAGALILMGLWTRSLSFLVCVYTFATALIGHHYWNMAGADHAANMIHFYKNVSITGGFLLLVLTGAGRYSLDGRSNPSER